MHADSPWYQVSWRGSTMVAASNHQNTSQTIQPVNDSIVVPSSTPTLRELFPSLYNELERQKQSTSVLRHSFMAQRNMTRFDNDAWPPASPSSDLRLDTSIGQVPARWVEPEIYSPGTPDCPNTPNDEEVEKLLEGDPTKLLSDRINQLRQWDLIEQSLYTLLEDDDDYYPLVVGLPSKTLRTDYFFAK